MSLLPQISKILEKLFEVRMRALVEQNALLNENQYGFRKGRSTTLAVLEFMNQVTKANESKDYTVGVFVDLKKAFDTLNHSILLYKLEHKGIRGVPHNWLRGFLTARKQFVVFNECKSTKTTVVHGVPQGSIISPLLFLLYIDDIVNASTLLKLVLFADDTTMSLSGKN